MWSIKCVCSLLQSVIVASFFSLASFHKNQVGPPRFELNRSLLEYVEFRALRLVSIISPSSELEIMHRFFC